MAEREPEGWRNLRMGVFFLATAAVLFAALFVVGTNARLFERKYELKAYLPNAQQLDKGSMVALSGRGDPHPHSDRLARHPAEGGRRPG